MSTYALFHKVEWGDAVSVLCWAGLTIRNWMRPPKYVHTSFLLNDRVQIEMAGGWVQIYTGCLRFDTGRDAKVKCPGILGLIHQYERKRMTWRSMVSFLFTGRSARGELTCVELTAFIITGRKLKITPDKLYELLKEGSLP